ncbi:MULTISPECIES: hypothetical protein [unclassified Corynebacterium]|uniref:hypothetical protein n=1 Tax=unclassified Corynebacterium TaxID=2624378 RepID=UPI0029CA2FEB|nr:MULTISPECIES: hypothetical protein [unclassified Corynebacterium]WPF65947.1 hypothetical protein OLX12_10390 [Corynebacterium sp. 22KM0430]WPF68440.1 hypothetical protein OLW90_10385 [Corynebacterium sp. 21KM1197]
MEELLLTDSFAQRLRAASTHLPQSGPRMSGHSLTAAALHAAASSWEHSLRLAAQDRAALLADLSRYCDRARETDRHLSTRLAHPEGSPR